MPITAPIVLASLLVNAAAAAPLAQPAAGSMAAQGEPHAERRSEIRVRLGAYRPSLSGAAQVAGGPDVEGTLTLALARGLGVDAAVGWYHTRLYGFFEEAGWAPADLEVVPITASLRLVASPTDALTVSAFGGGGLHVMFVEARLTDATGRFARRTTHAAPAAHVGVALALRLTPGASVGVELRQSFASVRLLGERREIAGRHLGLALVFSL